MKTKEQVLPKWFNGTIYKKGEVVTNPFSGQKYELNGLELSMYDFIIGSQYIFENASITATPKQINDFNKAITWFRKNNVDAYYALLD